MLQRNIDLGGKTVLITGAAGFIGSNLAMRVLREFPDAKVVGIDSITDYYDVGIKHARLAALDAEFGPAASHGGCEDAASHGDSETAASHGGCEAESNPAARWTFIKGSIADRQLVDSIFAEHHPAVVVNLAAQAGVRYSITNPDAYIESNIIGFYNILEACRHSGETVSSSAPASASETAPASASETASASASGYHGVEHLLYASSSSVYGINAKVPYSTDDKVDAPVSLYAATKRSNELMAHSYSKLYEIPSTGLRFFTVYGPAGRPDMAYFDFTDKLRKGENIKIFNYGNCRRDFTYIDDVVEGILRVMLTAPERKTGEDGLPVPPYRLYNIGNSAPENLLDFVTILQEELLRARVLPQDYDFEAHKKLVAMQPGDVPVTYADCTPLERDFGFKPSTPLRTGLRAFAQWYAGYYGIAPDNR